MPYSYKGVTWTRYDAQEPIDIIQAETTGNWEFDKPVFIHDGRVDLIFRQR